MTFCQRAQALELGNGYSLLHFTTQQSLPIPESRSFELPGDTLHFAPDRPVDAQHVKLAVTLDFEQETISGNATTSFFVLYEEIRTISFDAIELEIEGVTLENGSELHYTMTDKKLLVTLDRLYTHGEQFTVTVYYHAKPRIGLQFIKPAPEDPTRPEQAWTFGQPSYNRYWFPCHDSPNERATTEILATVPARFQTISNGKLLEVLDHGETRTHHWRHDLPHAAYLVSLVVGDFALIEDTYNGKPVNYYVRKDRKDDALLYMGKTPAMMKFFSEYTGVEYPYETYDQTVVEIYTGAMEHTTCTTHGFTLLMDKKAALDLSLDYVPVVAHELAHQWFGDLVTCRDWSNAWLNEGFATYFERMWVEHDLGQDAFKYSMHQGKKSYLSEDKTYRRPIVYYIYHDQGFELFDHHLYNKGAWVLHMLRHQLTDAGFRRGVNAYLNRFRTREVVTSDLQRTLEEVTGHSLERFFQQWVFGGGHPELDVSFTWDSEHNLARLKIKQTQKIDVLTACFVMPLDIAFTVPTSDEAAHAESPTETKTVSIRVQLGEDGQVEQNFYIPLEREPLMIRVDPDGWLLKTLHFERPIRMLRYQLAHDPDIIGRIEAAEALGERREESSLLALNDALNNDAFWGVRFSAAVALAKHNTDRAHTNLLLALLQLDPTKFSRVREAIIRALSTFKAPQRTSLAERTQTALRPIVENGDPSYLVEAASAEVLAQTRTEGSVDFLLRFIDRPSWMHIFQRSLLRGLGQSGDDRVVAILVNYLSNASNPVLLRRSAASGLMFVGENRHLYSLAVRERAIDALLEALRHDSWEPTRATAADALAAFNDKRVLPDLEEVIQAELDDGAKRRMRVAAHTLRTSDKQEEQYKDLRKDLDDVREENRKLRDQLLGLEARLP